MVVLKALHNSSGFPKAPRLPQIPTQPVRKLHSYPLVLEVANIQPRLEWNHSPGFKLQLQSCHHKLVVGIEQLSSPEDPAVLDHPPVTINEHMVSLICRTTSVGIPSPAMSLWVLKPRTSHPKSMTSCKVKELGAIQVHSSRPMGTNTCLITIPISSSRCTEIP